MKPLNIDDAFAYRFLHDGPGALTRGTAQEREMRKAFALGIAELFVSLDRMGSEFEESDFVAFMEDVRAQLIAKGAIVRVHPVSLLKS